MKPVYTGPGNINLEKNADDGVIEPIGDQWHIGDGKTGRPIKTSCIFLIRHSIYGIAMYEGFRWFII